MPATLNARPTQKNSTWYCVAKVTRPVAPSTGDVSGAEAAVQGAHAMYYSGAADVTGTLRFAGFGRPEDVAADSLAGAVALMERGANVTFRDKAERAAAAGAVAAVIYNSGPREFTGSLQVQQPVPVISISGDEGQRLRGLELVFPATLQSFQDHALFELRYRVFQGLLGPGTRRGTVSARAADGF